MGVGYPQGGIVVPLAPSRPQPLPSRRTDSGCKEVVDGHFEDLAEASRSKKSLQISHGPQGVEPLTSAAHGVRCG